MVNKREKAGYCLFLLPSMLIFAVFIFGPMLYSFVLSLFKYNMMTVKTPVFYGLENFRLLFANDMFKAALKNTLVYTVFTVPFMMALGLLFALLINSRLVKTKRLYKVVYYIPYVSSMVAVSIVFSLLFNASTNGIMNQLLMRLGMEPIGWLSDGNWAMAVIILLSVWKSAGYVMVIYTGGLLGISQDVYEAVSLDPISPWRKLVSITLPLLRPTTLFLLVTQTISCFQVFTPVQVLTAGGPGYSTTMLVNMLYGKGFGEYKMGMASAIAVILFAILMVLTILQNSLDARKD